MIRYKSEQTYRADIPWDVYDTHNEGEQDGPRVDQVIEYIEKHLTDEISLAKIADYAGVTDYHFRTMFRYLAGITLSEYLRLRRLSEAGQQLLAGKSVTDVAFITVINHWMDFLGRSRIFAASFPRKYAGIDHAQPTRSSPSSSQSEEDIRWNSESKRNRRSISQG